MLERGSGNPERVRELCRRLRPILGPQMDRIFLAYSLEDVDGKRQIETYLEALAVKHIPMRLDVSSIDLVPPGPNALTGPYKVGEVVYAGKPIAPFGIREQEWIQHVGVFGRSGAGKTNLGFEIFRQLLLHDKPVLVFDWKRNYRDLLVRPEFMDVEVYTVGRDVAPFYFNPLIPPPGISPVSWLKQIIEVVAAAYCLGNGVLYLLQTTLDMVYNESGVYAGEVDRWPTFREVLVKAREYNARGRESAWLSSTLRALSSLCFGQMDDTLNTPHDQSQTIGHMLRRSVILECDALGQADKTFLISALLLYIHHYRMAEGEREVFKHAIMIEEAHHILANERTSLIGGQSVMEITFREIREFGEAIIILDQHPSKIAISALGNTYTTICLNLKHAKDVSAMSQAMLLENDEKDLLGSLEVGQAVVKLQGRAPRPFLIEIPEFELTKGTVTDNAIRLKMGLLSLRNEGQEMAHAVEVGDDGTRHVVESPQKPVTGEWALLQDIISYPDSGVAARYKRLGISVRQGQKLKMRAVAEGLLAEVEEHTLTGRLVVLRLTEKGRQSWEKSGKAV
ncbi:MAG: ATP-binding protein [Candidatus Hydrogenedentes bacterium]|nr:ATP-binding protein [Candidatus Hydrogenedentota bacterium]